MTNGPITMWIPESAASETTLTVAATVDIGAETTPRVLISGSGVTITSFGAQVNRLRFLRWDGQNTLVNSAALALPFAANYQTVAGEVGIALSDGNGNFSYSPISPIAGSGGGGLPITVKSIDYTALSSDFIIEISAASAARTITVPLALSTGRTIDIRKTDTTVNPVYISDGTNLVDAVMSPATVLGQINGWRRVYSDGTHLRSSGEG